MSLERRLETKLVAAGVAAREVEALVRLHPAHFHELHPPRQVHSIYFDTAALRSYRETLAGIGERTKVRLRWYGPFFGHVGEAGVEVKTKHAAVVGKRRFAAPSIEMRPGIGGAELAEWLRGSTVPPVDAALLADLRPTLATSYGRSYWLSHDGRCRLTIDADIAYVRLHPFGNDFRDRIADDRRVVVELKYAVEDEEVGPDLARDLRLRVSRNSKYARGIELLYAVAT